MDRFWYSLCWTVDGRRWPHVASFPDVTTAKAYAHEHAPIGASDFEIRRIGSDYVVKGDLGK